MRKIRSFGYFCKVIDVFSLKKMRSGLAAKAFFNLEIWLSYFFFLLKFRIDTQILLLYPERTPGTNKKG